jgi:hypothetical protein
MSMRTFLSRAGTTSTALVLAAAMTTLEARQQSAAPGPTRDASPQPPPAAASSAFRVDRLVDRVWVAEAAGSVPAGALYVFLSSNVLVTSAPGKAATLGTWAEDVSGLVITEKGTTSKVDVLELTPERLRLRIHGKTAAEITFAAAVRPPAPAAQPTPSELTNTTAPAASGTSAAIAPIGILYRCGADAIRVAFENDKAYVTWPDGNTVAMAETRTPETSPSRRFYSDGQHRVVEDTSETYTRVLFARAGFRPRACTPSR